MKKIILILTIALTFVVSSCNNTDYKMFDLGKKTSLTIDGATIYFDNEDYFGEKTIYKIYNLIKSKSSGDIYDKKYYEERLEFAKNGWDTSLMSYSKINISYEDHNKTVVIRYEDYLTGKLYKSSSIYIPYNKALKIFSENK